jgi:predicted RNA-binding protein YlxR (DUF448 family)
MPKPAPIRTCAGTGTEHPQGSLLRFVRGPLENGGYAPFFDFTGKLPGRGLYLLPTVAAYQAALKRKAFAHQLETNRPPPGWAEITAALKADALKKLGLARKAGHLTPRLEAVLEVAKAGRMKGLLVATDTGHEALAHTAHFAPRLELFRKTELEAATGWPNVAVIGLTNLDTAWPALQKAAKAQQNT